MDSTKDSEKIRLIEQSSDSDSTTGHSGHLTEHNGDGGKLNLKESFYIMVGIVLGTGVLIMPFTVHQLGVLYWFVTLIIVIPIQCICTIIMGKSTEKLLQENEGLETSRDTYLSLTEISCGQVIRRVTIVFLYAALLTMAMALLLVAASIISDLIPITNIGRLNTTRVWATVICLLLTPITYLGTYSDLKLPAIVAITTSLVSASAIVVNCLIYKFTLERPEDLKDGRIQNADQMFVIPVGSILFATAGAAFAVPNITVLSSAPTRIGRSVVGSFVCLSVVLCVTGIVPYYTFGQTSSPSTITTFYRIIRDKRHHDDDLSFRVITIVIEVLMMVHLTMATILVLNPLFLHSEEVLDIPRKLSMKRVCLRTSFMIFVLLVCVIIPKFEPVLSLTGGVPLSVIGIFIPLVIYTKLLNTATYKTILVYIFLVLVAAFIAGNFVMSLINIIGTV